LCIVIAWISLNFVRQSCSYFLLDNEGRTFLNHNFKGAGTEDIMKKPVTFFVFLFIVHVYFTFVCCRFVIISGLVVVTCAALSDVCRALISKAVDLWHAG